MPITIEWESVSCPLCGGTDEREFYRAPGEDGGLYRLAQCGRCGLVYTNPRPTENCIASFYPDDYAPYHLRKKPGGWCARCESS